MLFGDMADKPFYEIHGRNSFLYILIILMAVIMKSHHFAIIGVNSGDGDDRSAKMPANIADDCFRVTEVWSGINIEALLVFIITFGFYFFKRRTEESFHLIEESGAESIPKKGVVKMLYGFPESIITKTAFGNKAVNVRVPFEIPAKGMQNHEKAGGKIFGLIDFEKHTGDDTVDGMKKAVKECAVFEKEIPKVFVNGKNTVAMAGLYEFESHAGRALHGIFDAAGRAKAAVTAERNEF